MTKFLRSILLQSAILAGVIALIWWSFHHFPIEPWILQMQKRIGAMQWWSAVLYPAFLAGCNLLLLPAGILSVGSGLVFGLWWGFFLVWLGTLAGAAAAFGIARALGRQWVEKKLFRFPKLAALDQAIEREGGRIVLLSQLHPLFPTSLLHYLYGITRIRFWPCMAWTALGQAPGLFLYTYFGTLTQYGWRLMQHKTHPHPMEYVIWIGGLLLTFAVSYALGKMSLRLLQEIDSPEKKAIEPALEVQPKNNRQRSATPKEEPVHSKL